MVSRTKAKSRSGNGGKRKASSASSDTSDNTIGDRHYKKVKRESTQVASRPPAPNVVYQSSVEVSTPSLDNRRGRPHATNGVSGNATTTEPDDDRCTDFEPPTDLLQVISHRGSGTRVFHGAVEEIVKLAFGITSDPDVESPGLTYTTQIVETLRLNGVCETRIDEVESQLMRTARVQMANFLGSHISGSEELEEILNLISLAAGTRKSTDDDCDQPAGAAERSRYSRRPYSDPKTAQFQSGVQRSEAAPPETGPSQMNLDLHAVPFDRPNIQHDPSSDDSMQSITAQVGSHKKRTGKSLADSHGRQSEQNTRDGQNLPRYAALERHDSENVFDNVKVEGNRAESNSPIRKQGRLKLFNNKFTDPFDTFFYHVERYRLHITGQRRFNPEEGELFWRRASDIFHALGDEDIHPWVQIHQKLRKADSEGLDETLPRELLDQQGIMAQLEISSVQTTGRNHAPGDPPSEGEERFRPVFIPFHSHNRGDSNRRVLIMLNTPDMPAMTISEGRLLDACMAAFGTASTVQKVEAWSQHLWIATFRSARNANAAKGKPIYLDGKPVVVQHLYPKPPSVFICDITDCDVSEDEIAVRIAEAFAGCPEKPQLRLQESWKLYRGRQLWISVPRSERLLRFYIPMLLHDSDDVFQACFTPLNKTAPCVLCGYKHELRPCEHSRAIEMPSIT